MAGLLAVVIFVPALRDFLGFRHLAALPAGPRRGPVSVESAFPALEARLEKAVASSPRAVFRVETARLYMEMARVANEAGRDEDRDTFCDRAVAAYGRAIAANPIDAATLYETGTAYLLYNFPLMTYQDRAKAYFRQALAFKPADETINLNVMFLYFTWWPTLEDADKALCRRRPIGPCSPATPPSRPSSKPAGPRATARPTACARSWPNCPRLSSSAAGCRPRPLITIFSLSSTI